jgi:hypothetical protein
MQVLYGMYHFQFASFLYLSLFRTLVILGFSRPPSASGIETWSSHYKSYTRIPTFPVPVASALSLLVLLLNFMPSSCAQLYRPAIYHCCVTGCSRSFKSEPALKRHQTNLHIVPEALCPQQHPNANPQDTHSEPPDVGDIDAQQLDTPPPPQYEMADGFSMEKHPILVLCHSRDVHLTWVSV